MSSRYEKLGSITCIRKVSSANRFHATFSSEWKGTHTTMPPLTSRMSPLGTPAPDFRLDDAHHRIHALDDFRDAKVLIVIFMCNHCPFVRHIAAELSKLERDMKESGVQIIGINPNDAQAYPEDAPEAMITTAAEAGWGFPYLIDETQEVAAAYGAVCTPDFFVYGPDRLLAYRGCLDESRPGGTIPVTGAPLREAVQALLAGRAPNREQRPSIGCSIKWRPGREPADT